MLEDAFQLSLRNPDPVIADLDADGLEQLLAARQPVAGQGNRHHTAFAAEFQGIDQ